MKNAVSMVIILLAVTWAIQYGLSFWQLRRFYKRLHQLRRYGSVWIGKYGSAWRGRQFAVLVVSKSRIITRVEKFSGWTVMANLKPVPGLEGIPISDVMDDEVDLPVTRNFRLAMQNAVQFIQEADEKAKAKAIAERDAPARIEALEKSST